MKKLVTLIAVGLLALPSLALAEDPTLSEIAYILNTFSFLVGGMLVFWMAAGFAMLEAGLVRSKNVATICLKNISLIGIACILFYLMGYALFIQKRFSESAQPFRDRRPLRARPRYF